MPSLSFGRRPRPGSSSAAKSTAAALHETACARLVILAGRWSSEAASFMCLLARASSRAGSISAYTQRHLPLHVLSLPASCPSLSVAPLTLKEVRPSSTICLQTPRLLRRHLPSACLSRESLPIASGLCLALRRDRFAWLPKPKRFWTAYDRGCAPDGTARLCVQGRWGSGDHANLYSGEKGARERKKNHPPHLALFHRRSIAQQGFALQAAWLQYEPRPCCSAKFCSTNSRVSKQVFLCKRRGQHCCAKVFLCRRRGSVML